MSETSQATHDILPLSAREFDQIRRLAEEAGVIGGERVHQGDERLAGRILHDVTVILLVGSQIHLADFFAEAAHFEFLRGAVLPNLRGRGRVSIWSAACSTGEEPYSIAFSLLDELGQDFSRVRILATDISTRVLAAAGRGIYAADRFEGIPTHQLRRYVLRGAGRFSNSYQVKPELRSAVEFRRLNLMEPFSHMGAFPVIFCRNVMIYFDKATQQDLVNRLAACLEPGGYLLIGHAESLNGVAHPLRYVRPAVYQKPDAAQPGAGRHGESR